MTPQMMLLLPVVIPAAVGVLCLLLRPLTKLNAVLLVAAMLANLAASIAIYKKGLALHLPLGRIGLSSGGFDFALSLRVDNLSSFIVVAAAGLGLLIALYTAQFMLRRNHASAFYGFFLLTIAMVNGAVLANHLVTLLFFWEGMMIALYVMISVGHPGAYRTAVKAFFISGVTDLCMMAGIALVQAHAHTLTISELQLAPLPTTGLAGLAFVLLIVGATSKAGSMPFHSWIPDAAVDAPLPFMAILPGALEKLLGIYFLARISLYLFHIEHGSWPSTLLMTVGAVTILLAVLMALVQKDYKRLLSFHAISQVGYMILGIGSGVGVGIVGGLFHMVNNAMYKSTLFLTGGAVERQAGTTDLKKLGGLASKMPVTFGCFVVAALSISGVWPFNGFFSKEMVYDGALHGGRLFYAAAALGSFLTAASFLKLGHAAYKGRFQAPASEVKEAPLAMLIPMIGIAALCVLFGVFNPLPAVHLFIPSIPEHFHPEEVHLGLIPAATSLKLVAITFAVQAAAIANHYFGFKRTGSGLGAVDHIHYAPVAHPLYDAAERRWFDPYVIALKLITGFAYLAYAIDRAVDFVTDAASSWLALGFSKEIRRAHNGSHAVYLAWSMAGLTVIVIYFMGGF